MPDYGQGVWPTQFPGVAHNQPQILGANFTSTISPTRLNEVRFGMRRTGTSTQHSLAIAMAFPTGSEISTRAGKVSWQNGAVAGNYFNGEYTNVKNPQCSQIAASLQSICTLSAIADSSGKIVLQNPKPGAGAISVRTSSKILECGL
jgi:hypothetical protein